MELDGWADEAGLGGTGPIGVRLGGAGLGRAVWMGLGEVGRVAQGGAGWSWAELDRAGQGRVQWNWAEWGESRPTGAGRRGVGRAGRSWAGRAGMWENWA